MTSFVQPRAECKSVAARARINADSRILLLPLLLLPLLLLLLLRTRFLAYVAISLPVRVKFVGNNAGATQRDETYKRQTDDATQRLESSKRCQRNAGGLRGQVYALV